MQLDLAENAPIDSKAVRLKTSKGIRLGSMLDAARSAYGIKAEPGEGGRSRAVLKNGARCTRFFAPSAPFKITTIDVGLCTQVR